MVTYTNHALGQICANLSTSNKLSIAKTDTWMRAICVNGYHKDCEWWKLLAVVLECSRVLQNWMKFVGSAPKLPMTSNTVFVIAKIIFQLIWNVTVIKDDWSDFTELLHAKMLSNVYHAGEILLKKIYI